MYTEINTWPGWKSIRLIGAGTFGKVYEIHKETGGMLLKAALKVIRIPQDEEELKRIANDGQDPAAYCKELTDEFIAGIRLMSSLKGAENIVSCEEHMVVHDKEGPGRTILVRMELLNSLTEWLKQHEFSQTDVMKLGVDICKALEVC